MKRNFSINFIGWLIIIVLMMAKTGFAQNERSLYFMPDVPQSRYVNPAHFPDYNLHVGLPVLSSVRFGVENTFNYDDIFQKRGDSILLDRNYMLNNLIDKNAINFDMMIEYFSVGFKHTDNYFTFRIADVGNANAVLTTETLRFALFGNGSEEFIGRTVDLSDNAINFSYYREYAFGFTRKINGKLNIGTNIKYLQGIANVFTNDFRFNLETDPDDFTLTMRSNLDLNLSAPGIDDDASAEDFMPNGNNAGFAFDFGVQYQINEKLSASAGAVNIGYITWDHNVKNFRTSNPDKEFVYSGFDLNEYFEGDALNNEQINNVLDSIGDELGIDETAVKYRTPLPAWINLNANYKLTKNSGLGILLRNRFLKDQNWTTVSLAYTHSFNNMVNLMISNTFAKQNYFTPGFGLSVNLGPVQMYLVNENFVAPILFNSAKLYSIRFGINFIFRDKVILPTEPQNGYPEMNNDQAL